MSEEDEDGVLRDYESRLAIRFVRVSLPVIFPPVHSINWTNHHHSICTVFDSINGLSGAFINFSSANSSLTTTASTPPYFLIISPQRHVRMHPWHASSSTTYSTTSPQQQQQQPIGITVKGFTAFKHPDCRNGFAFVDVQVSVLNFLVFILFWIGQFVISIIKSAC